MCAWDKTKPTDSGLLINAPGQLRANWEALELLTDTSLQITNAKVHASAAIVDTKLAQITTAGKVSGTAITLLANLPSGSGNIPAANLGNACLTSTNQTIAGIKTFSSFPVGPSTAPTSNYELANKKYIDDLISAITGLRAQAAVLFNGTGSGTITPLFSYNIHATNKVEKVSTGTWKVYLSTSFSTANYIAIPAHVGAGFIEIQSINAGWFVIQRRNSSSVLADTPYICAVAFGTLAS